ncbi:hypothetical protein OK016_25620 [Vibrio chagasii]|nr:hypothetical protein [Vibrio chagasii]
MAVVLTMPSSVLGVESVKGGNKTREKGGRLLSGIHSCLAIKSSVFCPQFE